MSQSMQSSHTEARQHVLPAEPKLLAGKGPSRRLRAAGRMPAVLYGGGGVVRAISVDPKALHTLLATGGAGLNTLIDLDIEGAREKVLVKSLQREPVNGAFVHADFYRVDLSRKVTVSVPMHFSGRPVGVELEGGILDHPVREIEIECLPMEIPEFIEVDVSGLALNQALHVSDVSLPEGVLVKSDASLTVAIVAPPRVEAVEEPEAAEGEEGAEEAAAEPAQEESGKEPAAEQDESGS